MCVCCACVWWEVRKAHTTTQCRARKQLLESVLFYADEFQGLNSHHTACVREANSSPAGPSHCILLSCCLTIYISSLILLLLVSWQDMLCIQQMYLNRDLLTRKGEMENLKVKSRKAVQIAKRNPISICSIHS